MARITQIQVRRDTAANWTTAQTVAGATPILAQGEIGFETDTGKFKIGDGTTLWGALTYATDGSKLTGTIAASTATNVTGTVAVANGGTGKTTFGATAGVLKTDGSNVLSAATIVDADVATGAAIDPAKISGTASTLTQQRAKFYQGTTTLDVPARGFVYGAGGFAIVNGSTTGYLFTPEQNMNVTKISFYVKTAASWGSATSPQAKAALYSVSGTTFTPITVSSAWQTSPFGATGLYDFTITSTALTAGTTYAVGMLTTWSGTAPNTVPALAYHYLAGQGFAALSPQMTFITPNQDNIVVGTGISGATGNLTANYARLTITT